MPTNLAVIGVPTFEDDGWQEFAKRFIKEGINPDPRFAFYQGAYVMHQLEMAICNSVEEAVKVPAVVEFLIAQILDKMMAEITQEIQSMMPKSGAH